MFFKKKNKEIVELCVTLYKLIVKQSRTKEFYLNLKIPDTIDGRFELVVLHFFLLERVLDKEIKKDQLIYKELLEIMYKDFDMSLREIGVGDLSVGKKIYYLCHFFKFLFIQISNFSLLKSTVLKSSKSSIFFILSTTFKDSFPVNLLDLYK